MLTDEELRQGYTIGDWEVVPGERTLKSAGRTVIPEPLVFDVLQALARREGDLVSNDELVDEVWKGRLTTDESIVRCIAQLRRVLGDRVRPYRYVENRPRQGYRLVPPVNLADGPNLPVTPAVTPEISRRSRWWLIGATATIIIVVAGYALWRPGPLARAEVRSIAVLPVQNLGEPGNDYIAAGFGPVLVEVLRNVPELTVIGVVTDNPELEVRELCALLGVDAVVIGAVQRNEDVLKISYNIAERNRGKAIATGSFVGSLPDIFELQNRLGNLVREDLQGEQPQKLVSRSRPANYEAYDLYMQGLYVFERRANSDNLRDAISLFDETIELDPQFGPAYLSLAMAYALLPGYGGAPLENSLKLAIDTAERGVARDPTIRDAATVVFGFVYHKGRDWTRAEEAYKRAISGPVVDSNAFNWYARMLAGVGRREDALAQALAAHRLDPGSALINSLVATLYTWLGDDQNALEFYDRAWKFGVQSQYQYFGYALLLVRAGKLDEAQELAIAGARANKIGASWVEPAFAALDGRGPPGTALEAIDAAVKDEQLDPRIAMALHTFLEDVEGAMRIAEELTRRAAHLEMDLLFLPELRPLREHPRFGDLMQQLGIQAYWEENGCIWLDDSVRCPS